MLNISPIVTDPSRNEWMMMLDGEFICPGCIAQNRNLIDVNGGIRFPDTWAVIGYCGDIFEDRVYPPLTINEPIIGEDFCIHCHKFYKGRIDL